MGEGLEGERGEHESKDYGEHVEVWTMGTSGGVDYGEHVEVWTRETCGGVH